MRMRGLRNMLSRASPSRSFSLPGSTSASDNGGRREEAALPPAISPPGRGEAGAEAGGVVLPVGERRTGTIPPWSGGSHP